VTLSSIRKPPPSGLESATARRRTLGSPGIAPDEPSRSLRYLTGVGKSGPGALTQKVPMALESLIGADDRQRVTDTELTPWRRICSLQMRGRMGTGIIGTGWLVGPRTVITAGHCVYSQDFFGGWATEITVIPGRNGTHEPFGRTISEDFSSTDRWVRERDPDFDIGCIHLNEPVGETAGWFGFATLPADDLQDYLINVSGYPGDLGNGTQLYTHRNRILRVTEQRIYYDVDSYAGESGGPAWIIESDNAAPTVVGIHAYGITGTPAALGITANSAPRITSDIFEQIEAWVVDDGGRTTEDDVIAEGADSLTEEDEQELAQLIRSELLALRLELDRQRRRQRCAHVRTSMPARAGK
jgi:glutamyl endopeptidase